MATLFKQKGSKNWYVKIYADGKPLRIATRTPDRKEAQKILDGLEGDKARDIAIVPTASSVRVRDLFEHVLQDYELNGLKTFRHAKAAFKNLLGPTLGHLRAVELQPLHIERYTKKRLEAGVKRGTIRRELGLLKRAFTLGGRLYKIPMPHIARPKEGDPRRGFFETADFMRLDAAINEDYRPFLRFLFVTGWRKSEAKNLRVRDLNFETREIRLDPGTTKNKDGRTFPMILGLFEMLQACVALTNGQPNDHVFTRRRRYGRKGQPVRYGARCPIGDITKEFRTACYKAGLACEVEPWTYINPKSGKAQSGVRVLRAEAILHDFRRTAVRNLTLMRIPEKLAMLMTGHRTREVFERYNIVSPNDLTTASAFIEKHTATLWKQLNAGIVSGVVEHVDSANSLVIS